MTDSTAADPKTLNEDRVRSLMHTMVRIRRFEAKAAEMYSAGKIRGFLHLYDGEEAIAAGVMRCLLPGDSVVSTYREHGHALARGVSADSIMAELYGKVEGCSKGRGGSMHLFDAAKNFFGGNAIVGAGLPVAVGLAQAAKMQQRSDVAVCFFGEGAVAEGEFHEALNLAAVWALPVVFVCENNRYAMGTALHRSESQTDIHRKAASYNLRSVAVDGMNPIEVEDEMASLVAHARAGDGPGFMEARTYRFRAHSMFDGQKYRSKQEVAIEKDTHDPIELFLARFADRGWLDEAAMSAMREEIDAEVTDAVAFAEAGGWESVDTLLDDVVTGRREGTP